jgi:uncharacterized Zn finger protein
VKGGIKPRSRKGTFTHNWWAERWLAVLESFDLGERLARGRSYARSGQVLDIRIRRGEVTAEVQGSRPRPYTVSLRLAPLRRAGLEKLLAVLAGKAVYRARLLAGEMPPEIEEAFGQAGLALFPQTIGELMTSCSCPDWSNPCKHIAAVYYLLAEEFDRDPFQLLRLRGIERQDLVGPAGGQAAVPAKAVRRKGARTPAAPAPPPLAADPEVFWGRKAAEPAEGSSADPAGGPDGGPLPDAVAPPLPAALVHQLGSFPFWRGEEPFLPSMERIYRAASDNAAAVFARLAEGGPK